VVARVSRFRLLPEQLVDVGRDVRAAVHSHPRGYDPGMQAAFVFVDRRNAIGLAVADAVDAFATIPHEPPSWPDAVTDDYEVVKAEMSRPEQWGSPVFADFVRTDRRPPPPAGRVRGAFVLEEAVNGRTLSITIIDEPRELPPVNGRRYEMEYLFLRC
jgi:hypothetical protein